jgi:hypothetical protein
VQQPDNRGVLTGSLRFERENCSSVRATSVLSAQTCSSIFLRVDARCCSWIDDDGVNSSLFCVVPAAAVDADAVDATCVRALGVQSVFHGRPARRVNGHDTREFAMQALAHVLALAERLRTAAAVFHDHDLHVLSVCVCRKYATRRLGPAERVV